MFTVVTDHQPNTWFSTQKVLSPRLARWYERIRSYSFNWEHRPGRLNVADPLSRSPAFTAFIDAASMASLASDPAVGFTAEHLLACIHSVSLATSLRSAGPPAKLSVPSGPIRIHAREVRSMHEGADSLRIGRDALNAQQPSLNAPVARAAKRQKIAPGRKLGKKPAPSPAVSDVPVTSTGIRAGGTESDTNGSGSIHAQRGNFLPFKGPGCCPVTASRPCSQPIQN